MLLPDCYHRPRIRLNDVASFGGRPIIALTFVSTKTKNEENAKTSRENRTLTRQSTKENTSFKVNSICFIGVWREDRRNEQIDR